MIAMREAGDLQNFVSVRYGSAKPRILVIEDIVQASFQNIDLSVSFANLKMLHINCQVSQAGTLVVCVCVGWLDGGGWGYTGVSMEHERCRNVFGL